MTTMQESSIQHDKTAMKKLEQKFGDEANDDVSYAHQLVRNGYPKHMIDDILN